MKNEEIKNNVMNKEDILEASRKENKKKDLAELEIERKGSAIGMIVGVILAFAFFCLEIFKGLGQNYGFFALILAPVAVTFIYKSIKLKKKNDIIMAVLYTIWAAICVYGYVTLLK